MKRVLGVYSAPRSHWVGDGFPVRSLFSYQSHGRQLSPFLLLDHAGPARFEPTGQRRGVGSHPHRGFETVTIVYEGEVAHRDSTGQGGVIGPGDVQWMTAGAGILHEEYHGEGFARSGGELEMVQLWVNLPARAKMAAPAYQAIVERQIPVVALPEQAGSARIIAGELEGRRGPARSFTPMNVWDLRLNQGAAVELPLPDGWTAALVVLHGTVLANDHALAREGQLVVLDRPGVGVVIKANNDAVVLLLAGEPIDEPIVGYGPFVMNSEAEIRQAIDDFESGRFGANAPPPKGVRNGEEAARQDAEHPQADSARR
ncbi:MAG TPA: pirin family protein [Rhodocyclaceae bacterium]|nr:pirin family protein [Rhodocyclaceae bacterium]